MSIALIVQTYDEVRRLAIAGSVVVPGDFRIKKLLPPLEQAGKKSPVFAKVLDCVKNLSEATEANASQTLLEVGTLVNAILYTQGESSIAGQLGPIASKSFGVHKTQTSARVLKPLLEALTTTGSGRLEIIRDAAARNLFFDLRLIRPALLALDDSYSEIAEFVAEKVLPIYGGAIVPELQSQFDMKGSGGAARRLILMHQLDPQTAREFVRKSLEDGSKDVRVAAIECLGTADEDLVFLLEQLKAKARDIRLAAIKGLSGMMAPSAAQALCKVIDGADLDVATRALAACKHPVVIEYLIAKTTAQLESICSGKVKEKKELGQLIAKTNSLLSCFAGREDARSESLLLKVFGDREKIAAVKAEPSGKDIVEHLLRIMATNSNNVKQALVQGHDQLDELGLAFAFQIACETLAPKEVFAQFSPYVTAKVDEKKKSKDPAYAKREVIIKSITDVVPYWHISQEQDAPTKKFDPQWLDLAIKINHPELIMSTAVEGNAKSNAALAALIPDRFKKMTHSHEAYQLLSALARVKHPELTNVVIALVEREDKSTYANSLYWLGRFIPHLPKEEALPRFEALLPKFSGRAQDQLVDFILELKAK